MTDEIDDDAPVGRLLTRRETLGLMGRFGAGGFLAMAGCNAEREITGSEPNGPSASCAVRTQLSQGPHFVDERLNRSDIRRNSSGGVARPGALMALTFNVQRLQSNACAPLSGAVIDVWHCDANGVYSDVENPAFNTIGQDFLRGYQVTDGSGVVLFTTIVPGWYEGRAPHIHFKIRETLSSESAYEFTSQLFFAESFLESVYATHSPYRTRSDAGRLRNERDDLYNHGGSHLLVTPTFLGNSYSASLTVEIV